MPRICTAPFCKKEKTVYKGSEYCAKHTCANNFCKQLKTKTSKIYCDTCRCRYKGCEKQRSEYFSDAYCLDHFCDRCKNGYREASNQNGKRCCRVCLDKCEYEYGNCRNDKIADGRFCANHTCSMSDCLGQKMDEHLYCLKKHRCTVYKCQNLRTTSEENATKCDIHLSHCVSCSEPRPVGFTGAYYCDQHGCTQCHAQPKHSYRLNRKTIRSDKCLLHYGEKETTFPVETSAFSEFMNRLRRIVGKLNKAITIDDSEKHNLSCPDYCSRGYCRCDRMPRMNVVKFLPTTNAGTYFKETVYLLSRKALVASDEYSTIDDYMAWTIPKILVDEFDKHDTSEEALEKSIEFEYI